VIYASDHPFSPDYRSAIAGTPPPRPVTVPVLSSVKLNAPGKGALGAFPMRVQSKAKAKSK
jgi:hypothetical protein